MQFSVVYPGHLFGRRSYSSVFYSRQNWKTRRKGKKTCKKEKLKKKGKERMEAEKIDEERSERKRNQGRTKNF